MKNAEPLSLDVRPELSVVHYLTDYTPALQTDFRRTAFPGRQNWGEGIQSALPVDSTNGEI